MQSTRTNTLGKLVCAALLAACVLVLSGCTPGSLTYIANKDGVYTLVIPERCDMTIARVVVYYNDGSESPPDLWTATAKPDGTKLNQVVLFQPNDGYDTVGEPSTIDFSKELAIGWIEGKNDTNGGATGVLSEVGDGQVLWANGITSFDDYERDTTTLAIPGTYRCGETS